MKNKLLIAGAGIAAVILIAGGFLLASFNRSTITAVLYYPDKSGTTLISDSESISYNDATHIPYNIVSKLQSKGCISHECNINTVTFDTPEKITIDLSEEFLSDESRLNLLRVYAIVKSVCSTSPIIGITEVRVTVDSSPIKTGAGKKLSYLSDSSINIMNSEEIMTYNCDLYFKNRDGKLSPETREIDAANGSIEHNAVQALIDGPETRGLYRVFPNGTSLISAEIKNGVCYINFAALPKSADITLIESALYRTLSSLSGVEEIVIMTEGKLITKPR